MSEPSTYYPPPQPQHSNVKTALAGGALAALLVSNVYLFIQIHDMKTDAAKSRDAVESEIEALKESSSTITATSRKHEQVLRDELENTRRQANMAASEVKKEALSYAEQQAKRLESAQREQAQKVSGDIAEVKESANSANAKIADVSGDVTNVKQQVASTKTDLDKTISDLKKVTGDLGVQSGYIATNGKEIAALRRLGERNYVEFKLSKAKAPQKIGDVSLLLKKADPKKNRFTLELTADDKSTEKRDRTINEPIQFLMARAKQPYEIVVNEVRKDMIVGYIAEPKEQTPRN